MSFLPVEEAWDLVTSEVVRVLAQKKNWSAPGPDHIANFLWKRAQALQEGVILSFRVISEYQEEYPAWFCEEKTMLIPKPGEFTSDNQIPITCLNTLYKWFTSCLLVLTNQRLEENDLMEGARAGFSGTTDNLLIDKTVQLDGHRRMWNLSVAWIDVKKAYYSVDHSWLNGVITLHRFPTYLCNVIAKLCKSWTKMMVITRK